jgi:hypothetical protein
MTYKCYLLQRIIWKNVWEKTLLYITLHFRCTNKNLNKFFEFLLPMCAWVGSPVLYHRLYTANWRPVPTILFFIAVSEVRGKQYLLYKYIIYAPKNLLDRVFFSNLTENYVIWRAVHVTERLIDWCSSSRGKVGWELYCIASDANRWKTRITE